MTSSSLTLVPIFIFLKFCHNLSAFMRWPITDIHQRQYTCILWQHLVCQIWSPWGRGLKVGHLCRWPWPRRSSSLPQRPIPWCLYV